MTADKGAFLGIFETVQVMEVSTEYFRFDIELAPSAFYYGEQAHGPSKERLQNLPRWPMAQQNSLCLSFSFLHELMQL